MTKYFRITETREYMEAEFGYEGKHDAGDIVATNNYNYDCFEAIDEEDGCCTWISNDHAEEVKPEDVALVDLTKEDALAIYTAHIDGEEIEEYDGFWGTWRTHHGDALFRGTRYRVVTPEMKRVKEINKELAELNAQTLELEKDLEAANDAVFKAQYAA